jgi:hypothetical protein
MSDRKWAPLVPAPLIYSKVPARQFYVPYNGKTYQICSKCDYPSSNPEKRCEWCEIGIKTAQFQTRRRKSPIKSLSNLRKSKSKSRRKSRSPRRV